MDLFDASNSECEFVSENEVVSNTKGKKRKNQKAPNQQEITIRSDHFQDTENPNIAECIYCYDRVRCATKSEYNPLRNHIHACKEYPPNVDLRQRLLDLEPKTRLSDEGSSERVTFPRLSNQEALEKALAKMLIVDELPLSFVEGEGFRELCKVVNPHFVIPSRSTLRTMIIDKRAGEKSGNA